MAVTRRVGPLMLLCILLGTAVSVAAGLTIAGPLDASLGRWDLRVAEDLEAGRTATLDRLTGLTGLPAETVPVAVLWVGAMAAGAWLTKRWEVPVFLLFVIGGEKLTYLLTSIVVDRPRPPVEPVGHVFATSAFPSGHVGSAVTLYGSIALAIWWHRSRLGRPLPRWLVALSAVLVVVVAASVAFSRTYRGQHHPSDVAWGATLGAVWLLAGWRLVLRPTAVPAGSSGRRGPPR